MRYRLLSIAAVGVAAVLVGTLAFGNLNDNLVYYLTPTEAVSKQNTDFPDGRRFRLGGQVEPGTVTRTEDGVTFVVRDGETGVRVRHHGAPAQLFRSGIGVVLEGKWQDEVFRSDTMMVKHDENYSPPSDEPASPAASGTGGDRR